MPPGVRWLLAASWMFAAGTARAQDADPPGRYTLSGYAGFLTDYRFRGVSRSNRDPTVQASLRVDSLPGLYAEAWAAPVSGRALRGADAEIDLSAGWAGNYGGWRPQAGVTGYLFPGGRGVDFVEVHGAIARDIGPLSATLGVNYAPDQGNLRRDSLYVFGDLNAGVPGTPVTLLARVGRENGALADEKLDWSIGASASFRELGVSLRYVDTSERARIAGAGVVFGFTASF